MKIEVSDDQNTVVIDDIKVHHFVPTKIRLCKDKGIWCSLWDECGIILREPTTRKSFSFPCTVISRKDGLLGIFKYEK